MAKFCWWCGSGLIITLAATTVVVAAVGVPLPGGVGVNNAVKSPPLQNGEVWVTSIDIHNAVSIPNWAGYVVAGHVVDPNEVSMLPSTLGDGTVVPPSGGRIAGSVLDPLWQASGKSLPSSVNVPIMIALVLQATNTNLTGNDSQFDLYVDGWNIRHVPSGAGSQIIILKAYEDMVLAPSDWKPATNPDDFEWPPPISPEDPSAHWVHMPYTKTIHMPPTPGSRLYATLAGKATIDIQHVPGPASGLLVLGGVASVGMARRARRRRLAG